MGYESQEITATFSTDESPFIRDIVKDEKMAEGLEKTLTAQTVPNFNTGSEFSGFEPEDLKRGAISDPN